MKKQHCTVYLGFIAALFLLSSCGSKKIAHRKTVDKQINTTRSNRNVSVLQRKYAEVLGVNSDEIQNVDLYQFVEDWLGVPYRYGGQSKSGVDCSSFSGYLARDVYHIDLPRQSSQQAAQVKRKYIGQLKEGDLVFFQFGRKGIDHVGIYLQNGKFVHASTSKGVVISNLNDPWYRKVYVKAGTYQ